MLKCLEIALQEEGYTEKSKAAYKANPNVIYEKINGAGSDNYTKFNKEMHDVYPLVMDFPAAWCDAFVDWCFYKAYGVANAKELLGGDFNDYTKASITLYQNHDAFTFRDQRKPEAGCQVFFSSNGTYNGVHHTGLVVEVVNDIVTTIEGNTSTANKVVPNGGQVCKKKYSLKDPAIYGYGWPNYALYDLSDDYYKKGEEFDIIAYVGKSFETPSTGKLTAVENLRIRKEPDYSIRDRWFKTPKGFVSAYMVEGDITDDYGTWTERKDHNWPRLCAIIQNGKERHYDKDGYILVPGRLTEQGVVIYGVEHSS